LQEAKNRFSGDGPCKILNYDKFNNSIVKEDDVSSGSNFYLGKYLSFQSFTIFMKIAPEKDQQVDFTFYSCLNYNEGGSCEIGKGIGKGKGIDPKETNFSLHEGDQNYLEESPLKEGLKNNIRSIKISRPIGFVVFEGQFGESQWKQHRCQIFFSNDRNLLDDDIGRCGGGCYFTFRAETEERQVNSCVPCMDKATFIKGKIL
jgi:hypothetical protein